MPFKSRKRKPPLERFHAFVKKCEGPRSSPCWVWQGALSNGYGNFTLSRPRRNITAHKWYWEHINGPKPMGMDLDHLCRNRSCVNPEHLELVTRSTNILRGNLPSTNTQRALARTHCPQGHPYSEDNTYLERTSKGQVKRHCRICRSIRQKLRNAKLRNIDD